MFKQSAVYLSCIHHRYLCYRYILYSIKRYGIRVALLNYLFQDDVHFLQCLWYCIHSLTVVLTLRHLHVMDCRQFSQKLFGTKHSVGNSLVLKMIVSMFFKCGCMSYCHIVSLLMSTMSSEYVPHCTDWQNAL